MSGYRVLVHLFVAALVSFVFLGLFSCISKENEHEILLNKKYSFDNEKKILSDDSCSCIDAVERSLFKSGLDRLRSNKEIESNIGYFFAKDDNSKFLYILRKKLPGRNVELMTVGEIIQFEKDSQRLEDSLYKIKNQPYDGPAFNPSDFSGSPVSIVVTSKYCDEKFIHFNISVVNNTNIPINAVRGIISFSDVFGKNIRDYWFYSTDVIPPKEPVAGHFLTLNNKDISTYHKPVSNHYFAPNYDDRLSTLKMKTEDLTNLTVSFQSKEILFVGGSIFSAKEK